MLENKKAEQIAGIISDYFDGTMAEADVDILALDIYEKAFKWQQVEIDTLKSEKENLERTLEESAERIEELEGQFAYECECNKQFVSLQNRWQELKDYIKNTNHSIGTLRDVNDILDKMQELEAEDV